jgi:hypothetical protein
MYAANGRSLPILYETHLSHPRHSKHESPLFPRGLCQIKRERLLWRESSAEPLKQAVQNSSQSVRDLITSLDHPAHSMIAVDLGDWDQCWSLDGPQCVARAGLAGTHRSASVFARWRQRLQRPAHNAGMFVFPHVNLCRQQQFGIFQLSFNLFIFLYRCFRFKNLLMQPHPGFTFHIAQPNHNVSTLLIHPTRSKAQTLTNLEGKVLDSVRSQR